MLKIKIFLASSTEMVDDRKEFQIFINCKNKDWVSRGAFLELIVWEDFLDAVSKTRLQDEYNKAIRDCDIFVMLFCTKVGEYTAEEFETAFGHFKDTNKPLIFTYIKDAQISNVSADEKDLISLWSFMKKLRALEHFYSVYKNVDELKFKFNQQLDKLAAGGFIESASNRDGTYAPDGNGSDLNISPVSAPRRISPLDGHPVLSPTGGPSPLYTGGFLISFTIGHNGEGKQRINLHTIELEVMAFTPGARQEYAYRIKGADLIGAGTPKAHLFSITLYGKHVAPAQWITDAREGTYTESKSANFLDTDDLRIFDFAAGGANKEIRGVVLAQEPGLYTLRFAFFYSVAGVDRHKMSEVIHVYADK